MTRESVLFRAALVAALALVSCRSTPGNLPDASTLDTGPTNDPALVLGEFPLAERKPVLDGDTIKVEGMDASMRLLGIDTEETFKRDSEREAFDKGWDSYLREMKGDSQRPVKMATPAGMAAWDFAKKFFEGVPKVRIERDHPGELRDFYNRHLAYVFAKKDDEWVNYNVEVVRAGWSPYYTKYGRSRRFHAAFEQAQVEAREARRGIWGDEVLHYPDYEERLKWWHTREKEVTAFEREARGRADHVSLTRADALEVLKSHERQQVKLLGLVGDIKEPTKDNAPWLVKLSKNRFKSFNLVFFDKAVLDATGLAGQSREYVVATGEVTVYRGEPQMIVRDASQIRTFVPPAK